MRLIKVGNFVYENIEKDGEIYEQLEAVFTNEDELKKSLKDTVDWFTTQYINKKLQEIQEDLQDIATEQSWLEGVFYSIGLNPSDVKAEVTKVVIGQQTEDDAITNLNIPDDFVEDFKRVVEIAKIIAWKEKIWKAEAELEAQVDSKTLDELLELDVKKLCEDTYSAIPLEV